MRAAGAFSRALANAVRAEARSGAYDVAHVDGVSASALGHALIGLPAVLDAAGSASLALARGSRAGWRVGALVALDLGRTRRHEGAYVESYDRVFCASAEDAWALGLLSGGADEQAIHVIPTPIDAGREAGLLSLRDQGALLLCAGADGRADESFALVAREVMPAIWRQHADIRLLVAGALPERLARAADPRILRVGTDDTRAVMQATLALASGSGESADHALLAMSLGAPLVAGPATARALQAAPGRDLVLADGPTAMARAILELLDDPRYRGQLGRAGRAYVERHHSLNVAAYELEQIYAAARGAEHADWRLDMGLSRLLSREVGGS
jgi:glycosyltransferase involved in cell wall biosynthesis